MIFEFKHEIEVEIDEIIANYNITKNWNRVDIYDAVNDYISELDDCEYYPLLSKLNTITDEVIKFLKNKS